MKGNGSGSSSGSGPPDWPLEDGIRVHPTAEPNTISAARFRGDTVATGFEPGSGSAAEAERRVLKRWQVPEQIARDFVKVDNGQYLFKNARKAFRVRGETLIANSDSPELIAQLLVIAHANGAEVIQTTGTERFRNAVSMVMTAMEVAADREGLQAHAAPRETPESKANDAPDPEYPGVAVKGRLIAVGAAPLDFKPDGEPSYYVTIRSGGKSHTFFDHDLQRAVENSITQVQVGTRVQVRSLPRDTLLTEPQESVAQRKARQAQPNRGRDLWVVEEESFFDWRQAAADVLRDPKTDLEKSGRLFPVLANIREALRTTEKILELSKVQEAERLTYLRATRENFAQRLVRGEPIPTFVSFEKLMGDVRAELERRRGSQSSEQEKTEEEPKPPEKVPDDPIR